MNDLQTVAPIGIDLYSTPWCDDAFRTAFMVFIIIGAAGAIFLSVFWLKYKKIDLKGVITSLATAAASARALQGDIYGRSGFIDKLYESGSLQIRPNILFGCFVVSIICIILTIAFEWRALKKKG